MSAFNFANIYFSSSKVTWLDIIMVCYLSFQVGDFYEAIGFDACVLVEHAGLNPFGGLRSDSIPRAGCPVVVCILPAEIISPGFKFLVYSENWIGNYQLPSVSCFLEFYSIILWWCFSFFLFSFFFFKLPKQKEREISEMRKKADIDFVKVFNCWNLKLVFLLRSSPLKSGIFFRWHF